MSSDRIDPRTDLSRIGDEPDPWDEFLEGRVTYLDLDPENQARARRFGLV